MSRHEVWRVDPDHGKIRVRVVADQLRAVLSAVGNSDFDLCRAVHNVTIRENETVRRENETGAAAARFVWDARIVSSPIVCGLLYFDVDDGRAHFFRR